MARAATQDGLAEPSFGLPRNPVRSARTGNRLWHHEQVSNYPPEVGIRGIHRKNHQLEQAGAGRRDLTIECADRSGVSEWHCVKNLALKHQLRHDSHLVGVPQPTGLNWTPSGHRQVDSNPVGQTDGGRDRINADQPQREAVNFEQHAIAENVLARYH